MLSAAEEIERGQQRLGRLLAGEGAFHVGE